MRRLLLSLFLVLFSVMPALADNGQFITFGPFFDSGELQTGIKVYHYASGTTTLKNCWSDYEKSTTVAQPIVADANGIVSMYCEAGGLYKFRIDTSADVTLYTYDKVRVSKDFGLVFQVEDYASLNAAVSSIGSTEATLAISSDQAVASNVTVPQTLHLWFLQGGRLTPAVSVTATIYSPDSVIAPCTRRIYYGSGTVSFTTAGHGVCPEHWGAAADSVTVSDSAWQAAHDSLPSGGGRINPASGKYVLSATLSFTKPIIIEGHGMEVTKLERNNVASGGHGIASTMSLTLRHLSLQVGVIPTLNYNMRAVSVENVATSNQSAVFEYVKVRGYNFGIFADGGTQYNLSQVAIRGADVQINGVLGTIAECVVPVRTELFTIDGSILDSNNVGDHALYAIGVKNIHIRGNTFLNADASDGSKAIKLVGYDASEAITYPIWEVTHNTITNSDGAFVAYPSGTSTLQHLVFSGNSIHNMTTTYAGDFAAIETTHFDSSVIENISMTDNKVEDVTKRVFYFQTGVGDTTHNITISRLWVKNWSTSSAGTYPVIGTSSNGTVGTVWLSDIYADGATNGRMVIQQGAMDNVTRVITRGLIELNTTNSSFPLLFTASDTTPSVSYGNWWKTQNGSATSITMFDSGYRGQEIVVECGDANTTIVDGGNLKLAGNLSCTADDYIRLIFDGTDWKELGRSVN